MEKLATNFDYAPNQAGFMNEVQRTLVQQDDFRGIGGHGMQEHGNHGMHSQTSIGMGNGMTVNFRELGQ